LIRLVTLSDYDPKQLEKLCGLLYAAFGVGCEHSKRVHPPSGAEPYDANKLLTQVETVRAYSDDKLLYLTAARLKDRPLPSGTAPTSGYAWYGRDRALVSTNGMKNFEDNLKLVARHSLHQLGHAWELHHCLDPRCSMYLPWTPSFSVGDAIFCVFCREKSEQKIRLAKS